MSDAKSVKKLGAAGGIAAALAVLAHGADDCARAGVRASAGAGDDIARIAPVAAGEFAGPGARVRPSVVAAASEALSTASPGKQFGEELAGHTIDAVDLLLEISGDAEQVQSWGPIGTPTYITLEDRSSPADFTRELGAAKVGPPVFVLGQASGPDSDAISLIDGALLGVGAIQGECLSHGLSCIVLTCRPKNAVSMLSCVTRAHALTLASVAKGSRRLDRVLRELLHERAVRRWDTLSLYRLADTPEGPRIIRSRKTSRIEKAQR